MVRNKLKQKMDFKKSIPLAFMALPGILSLVLFRYVPMFGIVMAFNNYKPRFGIFGSEWVGFSNFKYLFSSGEVFRAIGNTIFYHIAQTIALTVVGLFLAIMLFFINNRFAAKAFQKALVLPFMISYVIIAYIVFILLSNDYGLVNNFLEMTGHERIAWYMEPSYWRLILIAVPVWYGAGIKSVYYYASMMSIDHSLFEAADMDGANRFHKVFKIILPDIVPIICIFLITDLGALLSSNLALYQSVPMDSSALYSTTDVLATYVYRGLVTGNYSVTTALGLFTGVVATVCTLSVNKVVKVISPGNEML